MRILHIADIHFQSPSCLTPETDPDVTFRRRLEADLVELCVQDGIGVDAILVGGDIAYKGHADEYSVAKEWLLQLAAKCGCKPSGILTVPGNHDIDRSICSNVDVSNAQNTIANENNTFNRDRQLSRQLGHSQTGEALFSPMMAYNQFAAQFDCSIYPSRPFWQKDLVLAEEVTLRIFGLTSVLISGHGYRDEAPGRLFLGKAQLTLDSQDDVLNLVLCHHPPSWFSDASDVENLINARAQLQFFGHEHDQRCTRTPEYFRFMAGAVNPAQDEPGWCPGYNLIDIKVIGEGMERAVEVKARLRHFQRAPNELFVPLLTQRREEIWGQQLRLPKKPIFSRANATPTSKAQNQTESDTATSMHIANEVISAEVLPIHQTECGAHNASTENLIFRFWQLTGSQQRDITIKLGLLTLNDFQISPHERYRKAFNVAKRKELLIELAMHIENYETTLESRGKCEK